MPSSTMLRKRSNFATRTSFQNAVNWSLTAASFIREISGWRSATTAPGEDYPRGKAVAIPDSPPATRIGHRVFQEERNGEQSHRSIGIAAIGLRSFLDRLAELRHGLCRRRVEIEDSFARIRSADVRAGLLFVRGVEIEPRRLTGRRHDARWRRRARLEDVVVVFRCTKFEAGCGFCRGRFRRWRNRRSRRLDIAGTRRDLGCR